MLCSSTTFAVEKISTVYHVSGVTCGKYLSNIADNPQYKEVYSWWLAGFITAVNLEKKRLTTTDKEANEYWVEQYCKKTPLDQYINAAVNLSKELDKMGN